MSIRQLLRRGYRPGKLASNTLAGAIWQSARLGCQLLTLLLAARALGPSQYGMFAGLLGLATAAGGLTGLGTGTLLLRDVSRDHSSLGRSWWATRRLFLLTALALSIAVVLLAPEVLHAQLPLSAFVAASVAELFCYPYTYLCGFALQAFERVGIASSLAAIMAASRLVAVIVFVTTLNSGSLADYLNFHLAASLLAAVICHLLTVRNLPASRGNGPKMPYTWREIRTSLSFSCSWFTANALSELDKTMGVRYAGATVTGYYTIAYRAISTLVTPISSLLLAAQPRLFRMAHAGSGAELKRLSILITITTAVYALICTCLLPLLIRIVPILFGDKFAPSIHAAMLLAPLIVLICMRMLTGSILTALDRQAWRALLEAGAIGFLMVASPFLMTGRGVAGIALSIALTEGLLLLSLTVATLIAFRSTRHQSISQATSVPPAESI